MNSWSRLKFSFSSFEESLVLSFDSNHIAWLQYFVFYFPCGGLNCLEFVNIVCEHPRSVRTKSFWTSASSFDRCDTLESTHSLLPAWLCVTDYWRLFTGDSPVRSPECSKRPACCYDLQFVSHKIVTKREIRVGEHKISSQLRRSNAKHKVFWFANATRFSNRKFLFLDLRFCWALVNAPMRFIEASVFFWPIWFECEEGHSSVLRRNLARQIARGHCTHSSCTMPIISRKKWRTSFCSKNMKNKHQIYRLLSMNYLHCLATKKLAFSLA